LLSPLYLKQGGLSLYLCYDHLRKSQWWSRQRIEEHQLGRLKSMISYAYERVPYYKQVFDKQKVNPGQIRCFEDMERIPILTKEEVRSNFPRLLPRQAGKAYDWSNTSGTTGKPFRILYSKQLATLIGAIYELMFEIAGVDTLPQRILGRSRRVCFDGLGGLARGFYFRHNPDYDPFIRQILFKHVVDDKTLSEYAKIIRKLRPRFMLIRPQTCYLFARYLESQGIDDICFESICSAGEMLLEPQRSEIEDRFSCRIFNFYASNEDLIRGFECREHAGLHIHPELSFTETISNGKQVFDRPGRIVSTTLLNSNMPFIRYEMGDIGTITRKRCSCGRESLILKSLEGRINDTIRLKGKHIFPLAFINLISRARNIRESQVVQESESEIVLRLVKASNFSESDRRYLISSMRRLLGHGIRVRISYEKQIFQDGKKFRFVVSKTGVGF
jgi:phenylacetate-CoA ligase